MRPGREIDARIAKEIFGYEVWAKNKVLHERAEKGERPLRNYSKEIEFAWEVATKMRVSLVPIEGGEWFAFIAPKDGWKSPIDFLKYLEGGDFTDCGAFVDASAPMAICQAALKVMEKRQALQQTQDRSDKTETETKATDAESSTDQKTPGIASLH
jgi:hypothetical protein